MHFALRSGLAVLTLLGAIAHGATFGRLTTVRGTVSDIAVDERRGVIYAANYTANRIEVINTATGSIDAAYSIAAQPSALSLSPSARFLVVTHASTLPNAFNGITILDLDANQRQTLSTPDPALTVAFGNGDVALVVTTRSFLLLNPLAGVGYPLVTDLPIVPNVPVMEKMPVPPGVLPLNIMWASSGVSGDGSVIYAMADIEPPSKDLDSSATLMARFDLKGLPFVALAGMTNSPGDGPRELCVNEDGSAAMFGWAFLRWNQSQRLLLKAQMPNVKGRYVNGSHAFDFRRKVIYAQAELFHSETAEPTLHVLDPDNLTVLERIRLPQSLGGRSVITRNGDMMASVSQSGVMVFDLERLWSAKRVVSKQEDILFNSGFCDRRVVKTTLDIVDPNGGSTDFSLSIPSNVSGVRIIPQTGVTPAQVTVEVDPAAFANSQGTTVVPLTIKSSAAVNVPSTVRLLVNTRDVDQKGGIQNVPGRLVDVLTDPYRPRIYVIRQDKNAVLVFDSNTKRHIATMRTGNTPVQMAMTSDAKYLVVGNDNSGYASVLNLETLTDEAPIELPFGLYPRSIAAAGDKLFATARDVRGIVIEDEIAVVTTLDIVHRVGTVLPTLGIYCNVVHPDSALITSPSSGTMLLAQPAVIPQQACPNSGQGFPPNPGLLLYEAAAGTFVAGRTDVPAPFTGAYAALSDDMFIVDNYLLDAALVPSMTLSAESGRSAGALGLGQEFFRVSAMANGPGYMERIPFAAPETERGARLTEAPVTVESLGAMPLTGMIWQATLGFTRTLAMSEYPRSMVVLSTSGLTFVPPDYDAPKPNPTITGITNAADGQPGVAPGGLIRISGSSLTESTESAGGSSWPSLLGGACVTINSIPIPLSMASPTQLTGQLPFANLGTGAVTVRSSTGVSNIYTLRMFRTAPALFQIFYPDLDLSVPMVVRAGNGEPVTFANPIHGEDEIEIYFTGGGLVAGPAQAGAPSPASPNGDTLAPCQVALGSEQLQISSCALVPGSVGIYRASARVPWYIKSGNDVPLSISQGDGSTTVAVRVLGK